MTAAMVIRLVLLMTVMPGSCYADAVTALVGGLPLVPWHRRRVGPSAGGPAPAVACTWRDAFGSAGTADGSSPCPQVREVRCQVPPPAPPWARSPGRPAPTAAGIRARPGRSCWTAP